MPAESVADTPNSEQSIYFDAPLMHFFSHKDKTSEGANDPATGTSDVTRQPSVAIAGEPVSDVQPAEPDPTQQSSMPSNNLNAQDAPDRDNAVNGSNAPNTSSNTTNGFNIQKSTQNEVESPIDEGDGWLPAVDTPGPQSESKTFPNGRPASLNSRSSRSKLRRSFSARSRSLSRGNGSTRRQGGSITSGNAAGSTFANGAATTGPNAIPDVDQSLHVRAASAEASLTPKQKSVISKSEIKQGKRLSKVIQAEGKAENDAYMLAIRELGDLQKIQKTAVKLEAAAHTSHSKCLSSFQKLEAAFLAMRTKYEVGQAEVLASEEALESSRQNARETTETLQEKMREVETLRTNLSVDQRERAVKITELSGKKKAFSLW